MNESKIVSKQELRDYLKSQGLSETDLDVNRYAGERSDDQEVATAFAKDVQAAIERKAKPDPYRDDPDKHLWGESRIEQEKFFDSINPQRHHKMPRPRTEEDMKPQKE